MSTLNTIQQNTISQTPAKLEGVNPSAQQENYEVYLQKQYNLQQYSLDRQAACSRKDRPVLQASMNQVDNGGQEV